MIYTKINLLFIIFYVSLFLKQIFSRIYFVKYLFLETNTNLIVLNNCILQINIIFYNSAAAHCTDEC